MASDGQPLESICELIVDCPHSTPVWTKSGYVVLRNQNIRNGRLDLSDPSFTDADHFAGRNRRAKPTAGDVVITREAPMGEVCMIPPGLECCLGQRQVLLRPNARIVNPRFVLYALQSPGVQRQIGWNEGTGSTVSNLRIPLLKALQIPVPHRQVQDDIAETLGALDDRIDNLRQTNATLEAIAQALFKSWFVDFDGVPPEDMQESELGLIPKGWRVVPAGELYQVGIGKTPPRKEQHWFSESTDDVPWVSIKDMGDSGLFVSATSEYLTREAVAKFNIRRVPADTVLLSFKLTVGRVAMTDTEMTTNEAIAHFKSKPESLPQSFLYCYLKDYDFTQLGSTSSIATATNSKGIRELPILHPGDELSQQFDAIVVPLLQKIRAQQRQAATLASLRDALLPRLISGRLRLPQ
jgi:type I restriction enzyme S subunit